MLVETLPRYGCFVDTRIVVVVGLLAGAFVFLLTSVETAPLKQEILNTHELQQHIAAAVATTHVPPLPFRGRHSWHMERRTRRSRRHAPASAFAVQ